MDPVTQNTQPVVEPVSQPVTQQPSVELSNSNRIKGFLKNKKILAVIIIVVVLIGVGIFAILFFNKPSKEVVNTPPETQTVRFNNAQDAQEALKKQRLEIIQSVANYITTQKTPEGYNNYIAHFDEVCGGDKVINCPFGTENVLPINNSWSALGYYAAYEVTKDEKYLTNMNKDIESLIAYCTPRKDDCLWVLAQPSLIFLGLQSPEILTFIESIGPNLIATNYKGSVMIQSIRARELALFYEITKDDKYLTAAVTVLDEVKQSLNAVSLPDEDLTVASEKSQACWYTLAAAELAVATRDPKYLEEARLIDTDPEIQNLYLNVPFSVSVEPCAETYYLIYKITNDNTAYEKGERIVRYLEQNFYDSAENKLVWGENGVVAAKKVDSVSQGVQKIVDMTDTAYFAYLEFLFYPRD